VAASPEHHERRGRPRLLIMIGAAVILIAVVVVISVAIAAGSTAKYTAPGQAFTVVFPGKPTVSPSAAGQLFVRWQDSKTSIGVQSSPMDKVGANAGDNAAFLKAALLRGSTAFGGKTTTPIHATRVAGEGAWAVTFGIGGGDSIEEYAFIHGGEFYAVIMQDTSSARRDAFLSSFAFPK
jgi:hypothetical protein